MRFVYTILLTIFGLGIVYNQHLLREEIKKIDKEKIRVVHVLLPNHAHCRAQTIHLWDAKSRETGNIKDGEKALWEDCRFANQYAQEWMESPKEKK